MSWADAHVAALQRGETVQFRPVGHSMSGRIESGQLVTVEPLGDREPRVGEAVLCRVHGRQFVHLVKAKRGGLFSAREYQIGNNRGAINGWVLRLHVYGRVVKVEP